MHANEAEVTVTEPVGVSASVSARVWARVVSRCHELRAHGVVGDVVMLSMTHFGNYLVPLLSIPYLARVLGPAHWGDVVLAQTVGGSVIILVEYGFQYSATRQVARNRHAPEVLGELFSGVAGAKLVLGGLAAMAVLFGVQWVPSLRDDPALLWTGFFWGLAQALNVTWFFQGMERIRLIATIDIILKTVGVGLIFLLVRVSTDGWKVLLSQAGISLIALVIGTALAFQYIPCKLPSFRNIKGALVMGWTLFMFRGALGLSTYGNVFVLGLSSSTTAVAYYAGGEKIARAVYGLLGPLSQAFYPRLSRLAVRSRSEAARLAQTSLFLMVILGCLLGLCLFLFTEVIVSKVLGPGFQPTHAVLRVFSFFVPLMAVSNVLGIQWMAPLGMDKSINLTILFAGLLNLTLALAVASRFQQVGVAWATVATEAFVVARFFSILRKRKLDPFASVHGLNGPKESL